MDYDRAETHYSVKEQVFSWQDGTQGTHESSHRKFTEIWGHANLVLFFPIDFFKPHNYQEGTMQKK